MNEEKWYLNITYPELKDIILESIANMTRGIRGSRVLPEIRSGS